MHAGKCLLAAAVLLGACQSQETPEQLQARIQKESDSLKVAASATAKRWEQWSANGQPDSIASVFADEGRELPPNEPPVVGRAAVKLFEARQAATMVGKLTISGEAYTANGPLGVERGSYVFEGKARPGAPKGVPASVSEHGKYMIHWQNTNGQWQIEELIWNSNAPMVPPAPAKKPVKKATSHSTARTTKKKK